MKQCVLESTINQAPTEKERLVAQQYIVELRLAQALLQAPLTQQTTTRR